MRTMIAAAALAACATAQAGVLYNWEHVGDGGPINRSSGLIEISNDAFGVGPVSSDLGGSVGRRIDRFSFTVGSFTGQAGSSVSVVLEPPFLQPGYGFTSTLDATAAGLAGSLFAINANEDVRMTGDTALWTVTVQAEGGLCGLTVPDTPRCEGITGRWLVDASTIPADGAGQVPEPGILPLMALASAGLGLSLRRKKAA